jgi:hypothetical protein
MKKVKTSTLENTANMCILCTYTRNKPCYTQFYIQVPFTLHIISIIDQRILLKWFLLNFCIICCSNWKSSAGVQFITYSTSRRQEVCWDIAKTYLTSAFYSVRWWRLMRPNTILLSTATRLQLDGEEHVPSFIAHHVQRHKIIPLSPFLYLATSHQADIICLTYTFYGL